MRADLPAAAQVAGVPRVPADDAIGGEGPAATAALRALRAPIVRRLQEIEQKLKQHAAIDVL